MRPSPQFYVQHAAAAHPGVHPFFFVEEDAGDVGDGEEGGEGRLFGGLAGEELGGGGGED